LSGATAARPGAGVRRLRAQRAQHANRLIAERNIRERCRHVDFMSDADARQQSGALYATRDRS